MDLRDPIAVALGAAETLRESGTDHALYGGLLLAAYGEARETRDADLAVVQVDTERTAALLEEHLGVRCLLAFESQRFGGVLVSRITLLEGDELNTVDLVAPADLAYARRALGRALGDDEILGSEDPDRGPSSPAAARSRGWDLGGLRYGPRDPEMAKILELWRRTRGDGTELERVVRPHLPALFRLACRLTGSESDAEDLLQDLLVRIHGRAAGIGALRRPDLWLSRVLYRLFVDEHRRQRLRPLPASELHGGPAHEPDDPVSAARSTPELETGARAERAFEAARLQRALDALPEDQRTVVLLHDVEGYRLAELAEVLDTPVGTLKSRLHRARRRLRDRLIEGTF